MARLVRHQKSEEPECKRLIHDTNALKQELSNKGLWPWEKRHPCDLEAILTRLKRLEFEPDRSAGALECWLPDVICTCETALEPSTVVSRIHREAAVRRVWIGTIEVF
jgi:hypothetical protein